jgi:signal peptidase I
MKENTFFQEKRKLATYGISILFGTLLIVTIILPAMQGSLHFLVVLSGSMSPSINPGDVVVTLEQNPNTLIKGDVITFQESRGNEDTRITHRVVNISKENNTLFFQTKGDANNNIDQTVVPEDRILGKVVFTIPYLGYLPNFVKSPIGFLLLIIIPGTLLITSESLKIYQRLRDEKNQKNDEAEKKL